MKQEFVNLKTLKNMKKMNKKNQVAQVQTEVIKSQPFKGADKIWYQILWDHKCNKLEYAVGYLDRFEGMIEVSFAVFETLKEDIPFHRIRYYKKNGETVWDRQKKINMI